VSVTIGPMAAVTSSSAFFIQATSPAPSGVWVGAVSAAKMPPYPFISITYSPATDDGNTADVVVLPPSAANNGQLQIRPYATSTFAAGTVSMPVAQTFTYTI
jgi:hypothetical protein